MFYVYQLLIFPSCSLFLESPKQCQENAPLPEFMVTSRWNISGLKPQNLKLWKEIHLLLLLAPIKDEGNGKNLGDENQSHMVSIKMHMVSLLSLSLQHIN